MKYLNYFRFKVMEKIADVKTVGDDFILFHDGTSLIFNFVETSDKLNNKNYKSEVYRCIEEIKKFRLSEPNSDIYKSTIEKIQNKLDEEYMVIKAFDDGKNDVIHIELTNGLKYEKKFIKGAFVHSEAIDIEIESIIASVKELNATTLPIPEVDDNKVINLNEYQ